MTETVTPAPQGQTDQPYGHAEEGKVAAVIVYLLYLAGVFSAHLISPIGVIVAYVTRNSASPWVRSHLDQQIKMFWTVFWWIAGLAILGLILAPILIGFVVWGIAAIVAVIFTIWFAVKSFIGLMQLLNGKGA
ncbi:MAG TPA: hypothetical protein VEA15_02565 [Caulobacteraceae bacterium]|nr:hypothetical protein [Caulobacteraceae bacterium]